MKPQRTAWIVWGLLYATTSAGVAWAVWQGRASAVAAYDSPEGRARWSEWKEAAEQMAVEGGPLARRPPKSFESPALILLRDHFTTCLVAILLTYSALFAVLVVLVNGALRTRHTPPEITPADLPKTSPPAPGPS